MLIERMRPVVPDDPLAQHPALSLPSGSRPRWRRWAGIAGRAGVAAIVVLSLVPGSERPHTPAPGQIEHAAAYALTFGALALGAERHRPLTLVAAATMLAAILESLQIFVPGRQARLLDVWASGTGAFLSVLGSSLVRAATSGGRSAARLRTMVRPHAD